MTKKLKRREFLVKGSCAGIACCAALMGPKGLCFGNTLQLPDDEPIDPKALNYCGYQCPSDCKFLQASLKNDTELKKEAYQLWKIKEKYNIDFDPETIFCFGCKNEEKPLGVVVKHCPVRQCVISKGLDCCIECNELSECKKELWSQFPDFKQYVMEMQKKYRREG
ncbi:MAG: DUF3795 domain-containing protein [Bacteroidales bacterium]|nr:DUF3795 domain-containing protein [Bacteroidales bacterium]